MNKIDQSTINFALYEDSREFLGIAKVSMPDVNYLTSSISGAGIAGNIEDVVIGHMDSMEVGIDFRSISNKAISLLEPRRHQLDLRVAQQSENTVAGRLEVGSTKHVFVVIPKSLAGGVIAPASPGDVSGKYTVRYWATYINGKRVLELDPVGFVCYVNGKDWLAEARAAMGK